MYRERNASRRQTPTLTPAQPGPAPHLDSLPMSIHTLRFYVIFGLPPCLAPWLVGCLLRVMEAG